MKLYQITVNGVPFSDPVDVPMRNAILRSMDGVVDNVQCVEVEEIGERPKLTVVEGGRK